MFSKEEKEILLRALWFRENEGIADDADMALIKRLQDDTEHTSVLKVYCIRVFDDGDRIAIAESAEEAKLIFIKNGEDPYWMEEVCEVKKGTFIG